MAYQFEMKGPDLRNHGARVRITLINKIEFPESVTLSQEMTCVALMDHPEYYNRMEKRQATRYRKMIKSRRKRFNAYPSGWPRVVPG